MKTDHMTDVNDLAAMGVLDVFFYPLGVWQDSRSFSRA